jgi:hypothetical protein
VDEDRVRDRFAEAVAERVYRPSAEVRRWAELGTLVEPYLPGFYRPWYGTPIEPASTYNPRTPPAAPGRPPPAPPAAPGRPAGAPPTSAGRPPPP